MMIFFLIFNIHVIVYNEIVLKTNHQRNYNNKNYQKIIKFESIMITSIKLVYCRVQN